MQGIPRLPRIALVAAAVVLAAQMFPGCAGAPAPTAQDAAASAAAFADVARVLRHPRCLNCHTVTDYPRVGDDRRRHAMNVLRGADNQGVVGMRCASCHQSANQPLPKIPGAPHWQLAPLSMGWEGLDDHDLAEALKDQDRNGGRSLDETLEHMSHDPLVLWGWDPGPGREPVPMAHADFVRALTTWIEGGAVSPAPGAVSTFRNL